MDKAILEELADLKKENNKLKQELKILREFDEEITSKRTSSEKTQFTNQELVQNITDNIPAFIALIDLSFKYVFVNNYYSEVRQFNRNNILGKKIADVIGPERFEKNLEMYQKVLKGESVEYEIEHQSKDKEHFCFKINLRPYFRNKTIEGFFVYAFDITEVQRVIKLSNENENKFKGIFNQSHVSTALVGLDKHFIGCNDAFCKLLGYSISELKQMVIADITYPEDLRIGINEMNDIIVGKIDYALIHKRYLHKNGSLIYGELTISKVVDEENKPLYFVAMISDITKRLLNENALKESEKNLRLITNNIPALVAEIDAELKYLYVNEKYENYTGFKAKEIIGKNVIDVITVEAFKIAKPYIDRALSGESVSFEIKYVNPDGKVFYLLSHYVPHIENEKVKSFFVLAWDITKLKKSEIIIQKQNERLKGINEAKNKLFSIIAHDLRNPFSSIIGLSELLLEKKESSNSDEIIGLIISTANKTLTLLENLLNWVKFQSGKIHTNIKKNSLSALVNEILEMLNSQARVKNISLKISQMDDCEIFVDGDMVKLVLRNLISNAIKFTNEGGIIDVSVIKKLDFIEISVSDNGVGISEDKLKELFKTQSNVRSIGTANKKGTGLGLLLCKEFIDKLGGEIWALSKVGVGTDFKFTLPIERKSKVKL